MSNQSSKNERAKKWSYAIGGFLVGLATVVGTVIVLFQFLQTPIQEAAQATREARQEALDATRDSRQATSNAISQKILDNNQDMLEVLKTRPNDDKSRTEIAQLQRTAEPLQTARAEIDIPMTANPVRESPSPTGTSRRHAPESTPNSGAWTRTAGSVDADTLTPSPIDIANTQGSDGNSEISPATAVPPATPPEPPPTSTPKVSTPIPQPTKTLKPPPTDTQEPVPTEPPTNSLRFEWNQLSVCVADPDVVQNKVHNLNDIPVHVEGFIKAKPDGGDEKIISEVPGPYQECPAGGWCGPEERIRNRFEGKFEGVVWGTTDVYYYGVLVAENSFGPDHLSCNQ
ncbi:MAG: hypothetical protein EYC68_13345 [Chloroflexota bacterium]|nr:MAG: hypothetical protein EYC68_13345 [Chloroflexota bacterium]